MELILMFSFSVLALLFSLTSLVLFVQLKIKYEVFMNSTQTIPLQPTTDIHKLAEEIFNAADSQVGTPPKKTKKPEDENEDAFHDFNPRDLV